MKLLFHSNTSTAAAAVLLPALASGYNMGGPGMFGRPIFITSNTGRCVSPPPSEYSRQQRNWVDNAFANLESEMNENAGFSPGSFRRGGDRRRRGNDVNIDKETVEAMRKQQEQQQEMFNKALDLANDVVNGIACDVVASPKDNESLKQQQKMWFNRAFGIASEMASGRPSPRYETNNDDEKFQIALDVPGVKPSAIDIRLVDDEERSGNSNGKVLIIEGQRESSMDGAVPPVKFKKEFFVDASVIDVDSITAQINNGVLVVTATKVLPSKKEPAVQKKIPVMQVSDDQAPVSLVTQGSAAEDMDTAVSSNTNNKTVEVKTDEEESA